MEIIVDTYALYIYDMRMIQTSIPLNNLSGLQERVDVLNKRAHKLGLEPLTLSVGAEFVREIERDLDFTIRVTYVEISLDGADPVLADWRLLAAVTAQPNGESLLRIVPGVEDLPETWRTSDPQRCDHCHMRRLRRDVFILRHKDGRETQVGRTCLGDFLGHVSPDALIDRAELLFSARDLLSEEREYDAFSERGMRSDRWGIDPSDYLTLVAACQRALGWKSRAQAQIERKPSTSDNVACVLFDYKSNSTKEWIRKYSILPVQERDKDLAAKALAWAQGQPVTGVSDYLYNLGVAARQDSLCRKTAGLLASAVHAYQREVEKIEDAKREGKPEPQHVGTVGTRITLPLTLVTTRELEGDYGVKTLARFEDANGNTLTWFASGTPRFLERMNGSPVAIKFTVKKHEIYNGRAQTIITRVAPAKTEKGS